MFEIAATAPAQQFAAADFARLSFLEGRWTGTGPDGSVFFDIYDRPDAVTLRSRRYADAGFTTPMDESKVTLEDGQIISRWGPYAWRAVRVEDGHVAFEPVQAPSAFHWRAIDPDTVEVEQRFTGPDGAPQRYVLTLRRVS